MQYGEEDGSFNGELKTPAFEQGGRTLSMEQACRSRSKINAGPILALRVAMLSPRAWAASTAYFSENRPSDWISDSSWPLASN
jgi:hypothetical protein